MRDGNEIHIALVGHCGPDAFALQSSVMGFVPGAVLHRLGSMDELSEKMDQLSLLLVNRVLDGRFGHDSGIELIRALGDDAPPAMLISNFPESLEESVAAGALMGFGKRTMRSAQAETALKSALNLG
jgi:hypothetical protein